MPVSWSGPAAAAGGEVAGASAAASLSNVAAESGLVPQHPTQVEHGAPKGVCSQVARGTGALEPFSLGHLQLF